VPRAPEGLGPVWLALVATPEAVPRARACLRPEAVGGVHVWTDGQAWAVATPRGREKASAVCAPPGRSRSPSP